MKLSGWANTTLVGLLEVRALRARARHLDHRVRLWKSGESPERGDERKGSTPGNAKAPARSAKR